MQNLIGAVSFCLGLIFGAVFTFSGAVEEYYGWQIQKESMPLDIEIMEFQSRVVIAFLEDEKK